MSAEGNYYDSFDYDALKRVLLGPLGPGGSRAYRAAVYDKQTDTPLTESFATAPADAALLFDGVFLMRPELVEMWDLTIFVSVAFEETVARARERDKALYGSSLEVERRFRGRYGPSQELYLNLARPNDHAKIVVYNDEPQMPAWDVRPRRPKDL